VPEEALGLILSSAQEAVHRLQFYRLAYGRINASGTMTLDAHYSIVKDFFSATKIDCQWPQPGSEEGRIAVSQSAGRLLLNLLIVAMGGMLKGGVISMAIQTKPDGSHFLSVTANGDLLKYDPDYLAVLNGEAEADPKDPKIVHYLFVKALSDEAQSGLHAGFDEAGGLHLQIRG
jgi:hypothetical protein